MDVDGRASGAAINQDSVAVEDAFGSVDEVLGSVDDESGVPGSVDDVSGDARRGG